MNLGIYLTRRSHLKVLSPVIDAALARRHAVLLVADKKAAKRGDDLRVAELETLWPQARITDCAPHWLDCLVGLSTALPRARIRMVGVDHFYDCWLHPPRLDLTMCYHSLFHQQTHAELYEAKPMGEVVGWLTADQARTIAPRERDSAVFFALKLDVPEDWRRSPEGRAFYKGTAQAAKEKAKQEGLRFVVKSRRKNRDPLWLRWMADQYVVDDAMVPHTSLALLARARWAAHFESGAVLEAALMGAYSMAIRVPQPHVEALPGGTLQYGHAPLHDWPGVSHYLWEGFVPASPEPQARHTYLEHFVGDCDGRAGERVVAVAEGL